MIQFMSVYKFKSDKVVDVLDHLDKSSLLIFDIDHTLIEPVQAIGSTHWERHLTQKLLQQGFTYHEACIRAFHQWRTIQHLTAVRAVEDSIYEVLKFIRKLQVHTLGLTARDGTLSELTFDQLKSVKLDEIFSLRLKLEEIQGSYPLSYNKGAVFCGFNKKDAALKMFIEQTHFVPKKIVFVDDQKSHVEELEDLAHRLGFDYVGMHYTASGDHTFDPKIADIQEKHLPKLISNKEALDLLEA